MLVLGVDPGLATTGYGLVEVVRAGQLKPVAFGQIVTKPGVPMAERLLQLYSEIAALIEQHRPDAAAAEQLFFNRNVTSALAVGQARGVVLLCLAQHGLPVGEYTPLQVKLCLTGQGRADKAQVGFMVRTLLGLSAVPRPDDVADALAVAICHATHAESCLTRLSGGQNPR